MTVDLYELSSLQVGRARASTLAVGAHDVGDPDADGLLGRDFLDRFKVTIHNAVRAEVAIRAYTIVVR